MGTPSLPVLFGVLIGGFALSALMVAAASRYSRDRSLVDEPGRRRSHVQPTPRGGGVGIVAAFLILLVALSLVGHVRPALALALSVALLAVAGVGWLDDHRPQPATRRLLVHFLAACVIAVASLGAPTGMMNSLLLALVVLLLMTSINFSNFMDGSNGLLTLQAMAIGGVLLLLGGLAQDWSLALLGGLLVATCGGFLPFNFPNAQIFLGDVGSGALGLLIGYLGLQAVLGGSLSLWLVLMLTSAIWIDAGLTLASRMLGGRRWYQAHREHLYQWLLRQRWSHGRVALLYLAWTLLIALPILLLARSGLISELLALTVVASAGGLAWMIGRQAVLRQVTQSSRRTRR